jgi:hypothetical protein
MFKQTGQIGAGGTRVLPFAETAEPPCTPMTPLAFPSSFPSATTIDRTTTFFPSCGGRDASLRPRHPGQSTITMRMRIPPASSLAGPCLARCSRPGTLPLFMSGQSRDRLSPCTSRASRSYASVSAAQFQFGQPVHETHPHILKPGECKQPTRPYPEPTIPIMIPGLQLKASPIAAAAAAAAAASA